MQKSAFAAVLMASTVLTLIQLEKAINATIRVAQKFAGVALKFLFKTAVNA